LLKAEDAIEIDATELSLDEVIAAAVDVVLARTAR
jgi:cytidylate kinase